MVTLQTAENALKEVYLGVIANQLNVATSPLFAKIKQSSSNIFGKEIVKAAPYGINGGFGAGSETDALPESSASDYVQLRSTLKNLYGVIEISDKAVRASASNAGAFVNLLSNEMENLVKACTFNLNRMLYGTGSGLLAKITTVDTVNGKFVCDTVRNLMEGMLVDLYNNNVKACETAIKITSLDRVNNRFKYDQRWGSDFVAANRQMYVQGSKDQELTGIEALFTGDKLYGLEKKNYNWLNAYVDSTEGEISDIRIQSAIDFLEENADSHVNFIATSRAARRAYQQYLNIYRKNVDIVDLGNGIKTISHNGIPVYADRFIEEHSMYLLNTDDFTIHQLADWKWLEDEGGKVIKQKPGYPTYSATLVKYAELMCDKPFGQGKISNIKFTVDDPYKTYIPPTTTTPSTGGSDNT